MKQSGLSLEIFQCGLAELGIGDRTTVALHEVGDVLLGSRG